MKRGLLYWINLEPSSPPEFGKIRPGLIVSNSDQNLRLPTVVIIPVSSRAPEIWPLRIRFQVPHGKDSYLVIPGIRQVNKLRLQEIISPVSGEIMEKLDEALSLYLGD